jgi:DNA-binding LytR/AlgR family response regulator
MMLTVLICDDEAVARKVVRDLTDSVLKNRNLKYEIIEFASGEKLVDNYPKDADLILLDIQMNKMNGIETAKEIRKFDKKVEIIFMTASADYARYGYEVNAYRYLMKCQSYEEFKDNLNPCIDMLLEKKDEYLLLNSKKESTKIIVDDILFIETDRRDVVIHTEYRDYRHSMSMKQIEKMLNQKKFYRCHTSYIVNLLKIDIIENNTITLGDNLIPISKHRLKDLKIKLASALGATL